MSAFWGYFLIVFMALIAVVLMAIFSQKNYRRGFDNGVQYENHRLYKVRLLRQTRRAARAEEVNDVTPGTERGDGTVQGGNVHVDSQPERGQGDLFVDHVDTGSSSTADRIGG